MKYGPINAMLTCFVLSKLTDNLWFQGIWVAIGLSYPLFAFLRGRL